MRQQKRIWINLVRIFSICKVSCLISAITFTVVSVCVGDMVMVTPRAPDSIEGKWFRLIYTEAFSRLGWRFVYEQYPSKRCAILSNAGKVDGEMERVSTFNKAYPNLIRVEERLQTLKLVIYATDSSLVLNGWESLKGKRMRVDCRRGVMLCEQMMPSVVGHENFDTVNSSEQGFKRILAMRIDVFVDFESVAKPVLLSEDFVQAAIYRVGVLEEIATNPFLHKKHQDRAPALANVLKLMKQEGLFDQYWQIARE